MSSEEDKNGNPVFLERIDVLGADAYEKEYIEGVLSPLLSSSVKTIGELKTESKEVLNNLNFLGGFESVDIKYDLDNESKNSKIDLYDEPLINVFGTITTKPLKPTTFGIKSTHNEFGNALSVNYLNRNALGHGEQFQIDSCMNFFNNTKSIDILSSTPIINTSIRLFGHLNILNSANQLYQSKQQASRSAEIGFTKQKICKHTGALVSLSTGLNLVNRHISHIADSANDEVKTYAGDSLKESIFLNLISSNMSYLTNSKLSLPLNGYSVSLTNEIAGFPSLLDNLSNNTKDEEIFADRQDQFYKVGLGLDIAKSILKNEVTFLSNFKFGSIINFASSTGGTIHFQDKFYPVVSGYTKPIMPVNSVGAGSFLSYNFGVSTKFGNINVNQPLRLYTSLSGSSVSNELAGFETSELSQLLKKWNHGLDVGLLYSNGDAYAKLFWKKPISSSSNSIGKFGFEVDIIGTW